jgi:hypothetical protein
MLRCFNTGIQLTVCSLLLFTELAASESSRRCHRFSAWRKGGLAGPSGLYGLCGGVFLGVHHRVMQKTTLGERGPGGLGNCCRSRNQSQSQVAVQTSAAGDDVVLASSIPRYQQGRRSLSRSNCTFRPVRIRHQLRRTAGTGQSW